jgi:hypothetical protein
MVGTFFLSSSWQPSHSSNLGRSWGLLVPGVNLCLMWLTYRFNRLGYIGLLILNVLSLVRPEIRSAEGLVQTVPVIVLSGFLYMKLFPKGGKDY